MDKVIQALQQRTNDNTDVQRRRFPRRGQDVCMVAVNGKPYPVHDWSMSGILFEADTRIFNEGDTLPMELKFRVGDLLANVTINGTIVRKNSRFVATQFNNLSTREQQILHRVIDESAKITGDQAQYY